MKLTTREIQIWKRIAQGATRKAIALELGISVKTVEFHASKLQRDTGVSAVKEVHPLVALVHLALRRRIVKNIFLAFGLLASVLWPPSSAADTITPAYDMVTLIWSTDTNSLAITDFSVCLGTNSRTYFTNWTVTATNWSVAITNLFWGTNYFAVAARQGFPGTNVLMSELSGEAVLVRVPPPTTPGDHH